MNHKTPVRVQDADDIGGSRVNGYALTWSSSGGFVYSSRRGRQDVMLSDWGVIAETFDFGTINGNLSPVSGRIYQNSLGLNSGDVVTNILCAVGVAGVGTAPTLIKLGLADKSGSMVALTANVASSTNWLTNNAIYTFALTSPYTVPSDGMYQPVFLFSGSWGTTAMQLAVRTYSGPSANAIAGGPKRSSISTTNGNSDLPAVNSSLTQATAFPTAPWMAVN